ncbi:MAG: FAD-binding oxidoreductase [Nitrospirota bacterium]
MTALGREPVANYTVTVARIEVMTPTVKNYTLQFADGVRFRFKPGQFVQAYVPKEPGVVEKPYSIASPPGELTSVELCIKRVEGGYVSTYFDRLVGGESLELRGPVGKFHLREPVDSDLVFLATGTGVVPFRSMLRGLFPLEGDAAWAPYQFLTDRPKYQVWLFFGVRYEGEILYEAEFRQMAERYPNFHFIPTISRPHHWTGATGYVQDHVRRYVSDPAGKQAYVCGLMPMIEAGRTTLKGMGFGREQIHYEIYT